MGQATRSPNPPIHPFSKLTTCRLHQRKKVPVHHTGCIRPFPGFQHHLIFPASMSSTLPCPLSCRPFHNCPTALPSPWLSISHPPGPGAPSSRSWSPILAGHQILRETCLLHQACSAQKSDGRHWTQRCRHRPPGSGEPPEPPPDTTATPPTGSPPFLRGSHRPPTPASSSKLTSFLGSIPRFTPCWAQIPLLMCLPLVQASLRVSEPGLITEDTFGGIKGLSTEERQG